MKFLFFDDWLFHRVRNLTRRYHQPVWHDEHILIEPNAYGASGASVAPAPGGGYYLYYLTIAENRVNPDDALAYLMARSNDGLHWERMSEADGAPPPRAPESSGSVCYDPDDADPARRYKATVMLNTAALGGHAPMPGEPHDASQSAGYLKYSPDGLCWTVEPRHVYYRGLSDTTMTLLRNPITGCFQVMVRAGLGDRRIFQVESRNLETWTQPRLVLHPCPPDPRGTLYYGMPHFRYGDMFLGFLQIYETTDEDPGMGRMAGAVRTELAFSYNGRYWMRTYQPFLPLRERGTYGGGSMYGEAFLDPGGDNLLVYAGASIEEHHRALQRAPAAPPLCGILPGTLRRDGFVGMATTAGPGEVSTYQLALTADSELCLNVKAPYGGVRVQLADEAYGPVPGYTYEECEEIRGDFTCVRPRWRQHTTLHEAKRRTPFLRIQVRLDQAELYSLSFDMGGNPYVKAADEAGG